MRTSKSRQTIAVVAGLTSLVGMSGCFLLSPEEWSGTGVTREGPAAAWTVPADPDGPVGLQGDVLVVPEKQRVRGFAVASGKEQWRHDVSGEFTMTLAGGLVVVQVKDGPLGVLDPATGALRWQDLGKGRSYVVRQDAVYADTCVQPASKPLTCTVEAHGITDGKLRWTVRTAGRLRDDRIGSRMPYAPKSGPYLVVGAGGGRAGAIDTRSGRLAEGQLKADGWYTFTVDGLLVTTDHDPPKGDGQCTVTVSTAAIDTGRPGWSGKLFSGRRADGSCQNRLVNYDNGSLVALGSGNRIAALTVHGTPQAVDLTTGKPVWTGKDQGTPIDGDGRSLLVRATADQGAFALLDFATGAVRWTAPGPGLSGISASWASAVTSRFVAVTGATDGHPFVLVYDVATGRQLGKFPSWLAGAGDNWVAVTHSDGANKLVLEFTRL